MFSISFIPSMDWKFLCKSIWWMYSSAWHAAGLRSEGHTAPKTREKWENAAQDVWCRTSCQTWIKMEFKPSEKWVDVEPLKGQSLIAGSFEAGLQALFFPFKS